VRRIFAKTVSGNEGGREAVLRQHTPRSDGRREDRGLRDLGQPKLFFRSFEAKLRELVTKCVVCFVESGAGDGELIG
jgi:hypothetical protein